MVFKKLLQHLATRGTYSPGDWRCDEAWREQTLVCPPVMCQQRLIYCTWELNVMWSLMNTSHKFVNTYVKLPTCVSYFAMPPRNSSKSNTDIRAIILSFLPCCQSFTTPYWNHTGTLSVTNGTPYIVWHIHIWNNRRTARVVNCIVLRSFKQ